MRIEWTVFAIEDRNRIFDYLEVESPQAAVLVDECIEEQVNQLAKYPEFGRRGRIEGARELVVSHTSYLAPYRITGNTILILRVMHASQQWPENIDDHGLVS